MAGKRELNEPHPGDKRLQRRDNKGRFAESDDLGDRSHRTSSNSRTRGRAGQGDRGDRKH
jgi:hypothetical protein